MLLPLCPKLPGTRGPPFTCAALAHLPTFLGRWWPAAAKKPKTFFFFFQILCLMFGEDKGGLLNWLLHCSLQPECLFLESLFSAPCSYSAHPVSSSGSITSSLRTNGTSVGVSALALVFVAAWRMEGLVFRLGAKKGVGYRRKRRRWRGVFASLRAEVKALSPSWWVLKIVSPTLLSCLPAFLAQMPRGRREKVQAIPFRWWPLLWAMVHLYS